MEQMDKIIDELNRIKEDKKVRVKGLEPPSLAALDPKSSVSTNFTTPAETEANISKILK